jgi:DNA-binding FadR family transcriptional regulator
MTTVQNSADSRHDATNEVDGYLRGLCNRGRAGDRLPAVRELQERFRVGPVTVRSVVRKLVMEGRAVTRPGDGTFIARHLTAQAPIVDYSWQTVVLGRSTMVPTGLDHLATAPDPSMLGRARRQAQ